MNLPEGLMKMVGAVLTAVSVIGIIIGVILFLNGITPT